MLPLVTPLVYLVMLMQNAVHSADGTVVNPLVQENCIHLARRAVLKALAVEHRIHRILFGLAQCPGWARPGWFLRVGTRLPCAIQTAARKRQRFAGATDWHFLSQRFGGLDHDLSFPLAVNVCSKACESFF